MEIFDISMTIEKNMAVYHNKEAKRPLFRVRNDFTNSAHYETSLSFDMHTGTHIDAPLHMIKDGLTMDSYGINRFVKVCEVLDFTHVNEKITMADLKKKKIKKDGVILLKTKNSFTDKFEEDFVYLDKEAANYLINQGIKCVGTDGLGIERSQPNHETHIALLSNDIMIIEGLRLKEVKPGNYTLIILPLKINHTEAAPARY